jgi:hypothetical protein
MQHQDIDLSTTFLQYRTGAQRYEIDQSQAYLSAGRPSQFRPYQRPVSLWDRMYGLRIHIHGVLTVQALDELYRYSKRRKGIVLNLEFYEKSIIM